MQLTFRNILIVVIILICLREVYSRGIDPLIGRVNQYPESEPFSRDDTEEKQSVVTGSDRKQSSELTSGSSIDLSSNKGKHVPENLSNASPENKERYPRGGQKPVNHFRESNPTPEPRMCFQFSSRNSNEPPMTVCEPITVARQAPGDGNIVRYNPYTGLPRSSTPLVVLPPNPISQHTPTKPTFPSPLIPGYGFQPEQDRYISSHYPNAAPVRLPQNLSPNSMIQQSSANATILPPSFPSGYVFQPYYVVYHTAPLAQQTQPLLPVQSLPLYSPSEVIPAKKKIFQAQLPPSYAYQPVEDRDVFAPNNYVPLLQLQSNLPPYPPSQITPAKTTLFQPPFPPGYANEAAEDSGLSPPNNYVPMLELQSNLPPYPPSQITPAKTTLLQPPFPPGYANEAAEIRGVSPPNNCVPLLQLQSSLPLYPPSQITPAKTTILPLPFPPGYAYEAAEDREVFPSDYYDPRRQPNSRPPLCSVKLPSRQTLKPQIPPRYGYHPLVDRSLLASSYFLSPLQVSPVLGTDSTGQVTPTKERPLQPPASPGYGFQPAGNGDMSLDNYDTSLPQLSPSLPQNHMSQFIPTNTELQTLPPGYGFQSLVNRYTNTPYYNVPTPQFPLNLPYSQMYYVPPSPPVYVLPYSPNLFTVYGKPNKLQSPNSKKPDLTSPSKSGLPSTIKEQEDAHTVPTPVEDTEKSQDYPSSRAVSAYNAPQYLSQELPVSSSYGLNVVYNPNLAQPNYVVGNKLYANSESYPNSVMQFTIGQSTTDVPPIAAATDFGQSAPPAALTCKVHNSEDKEAKQITAGDSIAILQLFLKPNPNRLNKYRDNAPGDGASNAGNSDVPDTTMSPVTQYDDTKTKISSKNIMSGNEARRGQPIIRGLIGNLKEEEIPSQREKEFHGLQHNKDGLKGNEEQKAMQHYQEQGDLQRELGPNMALLPPSDPWVLYQGQLAPPHVAYTPVYFNGGQQTLSHRSYYETNEQQEQTGTPQQLWGTPQQWWESPQLQFWKQYYEEPTQYAPANQSSMDQHLNNQLLTKANKYGLHVQKKPSDMKHIPLLEAHQERINEAMAKQMRLNTVKAKLLQQHQSKAAEKKERSKQVFVSGIHKGMNSSAKVNLSELNANIQSKLADMEGNTMRTKLSITRSRNSEPTEMSRENSNKLIQSTMKEILDDSRHTSHKARSMPLQEEPVNSTKIREENMATNDKPLNLESTNDDNMANGENMDPMTSYLEQGTPYELEQTGNANNDNTSYPAKIVTFINSSMPSVNINSENSSTDEGQINGYKTSHQGERIAYPPPARALNLKNSITDLRKPNQNEQNVEIVPDKTSVNPSQSTEDTKFSEYGSNKKVDQSSQNINFAEVPRMNDNSEDTLISQNQFRWRESETNITTLPKEDMVPVTTSVAPIAMMTEASTKFNMQGVVTDDPALVLTPKSRSNSDDGSESESDTEDSSSTNTKDIHLRYNDENVSGDNEAGEVTSRDDVVTSWSPDSIFSETAISSDSHKTDFSDTENKQPNENTKLNAQNQSRDNSANDVSDSDTTTGVTVNSEATLLPEGNSASHDMNRELSSKQLLLTSESSSYRNGDMLSNGYNSGMGTTFKSNSDYTNSSESQIFDSNGGQITGSITESGSSFKSMDVSPVSEGTLPDEWESTAFTQDQSTSSASESSFETTEFVPETTPSIKTEPQTSTEVGAGRSSNENSDMSDETRAISSEDGRPWAENENNSTSKSLEDSKIIHKEPPAKARSSEIDDPTPVIHNTPNNIDYSNSNYDIVFNSPTQTEDSGMIPDQENESYSAGPQKNIESGFPQTPSSRMRPEHLHQGNFGNSGITRTESFPIFSFAPSRGQAVRPSVVYPAPMRFMVYPHRNPSAPHHNYKIGPWPYTKFIPRPYAYHVPYASDYPIRYNPQFYSHIPVKNNLGYQRMTEDGTSRREQKDVEGQTAKGNLPLVVVLEE